MAYPFLRREGRSGESFSPNENHLPVLNLVLPRRHLVGRTFDSSSVGLSWDCSGIVKLACWSVVFKSGDSSDL
jgi:hypothetical protein